MSPFKSTNQYFQLFLSGMLLILILPSHVMTAPSRPATSIASCPDYIPPWTPLHRLLAGVEVLKTYHRTDSLQDDMSTPVSFQVVLDLVSNLVILREVTERVDRNLSELIHQNVKDAGEWLRFIDENDARVILQAYLERITQFDAFGRIQGDLTGHSNLPSLEILQTMWLYSNSGNLSNINCSSLYGENDCTNGTAKVTDGTCPICRECVTE